MNELNIYDIDSSSKLHSKLDPDPYPDSFVGNDNTHEYEKDNGNDNDHLYNEKVQNYSNLIDNSKNYDEDGLNKMFVEFENFNFEKEWRVKLIKEYIKKFIIENIYDKLMNKKKQNDKEEHSFKILSEKMEENLQDIKNFFIIFNHIKKKVTNSNYKLFIIIFLNLLLDKNKKLKDIWTFINNIYMIKIYYDDDQENEEKLSILNKGNNFCEDLLSIIIDVGNFQGEYFYGLFDYIYFIENFVINDNKEKDNLGIYEKYKNSPEGINNFNYLFFYENLKINESTKNSKWNDYIINTYSNKKFNIIYDSLDFLDCRIYFYSKIFEMLFENNKLLDNIKFINAIIVLIVNDNNYIFNIFSKEEELKDINKNKFKRLIKETTKKIETIFESKDKIKEKEKAEYLNSLILFLNLLGKFNLVHDIKCNNLNSNGEEEFLVIEKLFNFYFELLFEEKEKINFAKTMKLNNTHNIPNIETENKKNQTMKSIEIKTEIGLLGINHIIYQNLSSLLNKENENILIVLHSLTQCITQFSNINIDVKKKILNKQVLNYIIDILESQKLLEKKIKSILNNTDKKKSTNEENNFDENKMLDEEIYTEVITERLNVKKKV